jgi:hypothetical protein
MTAAGAVMILAAVSIAVHHRRAPAATPRPDARSAVRLLVERDGGMLRLRWNPEAPEIRGASRAVLSIDDGGRESRLPLETAELQAGMATYRPQAQDVTFRLQLAGGAAGEIRVSAERRPSPFEPKPVAPPASVAPPAPAAQRRSVDEESGEEPRATYTRYWTAPAPPAPVVKAAPPRTPAVAPEPPPPTAFAERAEAPSRAQLARREETVVPEEPAEPAQKHSRLGRVVRKIPLLRRLHKDR